MGESQYGGKDIEQEFAKLETKSSQIKQIERKTIVASSVSPLLDISRHEPKQYQPLIDTKAGTRSEHDPTEGESRFEALLFDLRTVLIGLYFLCKSKESMKLRYIA
jgi:hypothetical protein